MSTFETLPIFERDNTITPSKLRSIGYIPATIYGKSFNPLSIQLNAHTFELALARGVRKFQLEGLGQALNVEVKQLQKNNIKGTVTHIEFFVPSAQTANAAAKPAEKAATPDPVLA